MKRRQVLRSIVVISAGVVIFPTCKPTEQSIPIPVFDNLSIDKTQFNLLEELANLLLPIKKLEVTNPEPTNEFILNMVNDCHSTDDCEKYVEGLKEFNETVQENFNTTFSELESDKKLDFLEYLSEIKNKKNPLKFFFDTTLRYTKQHFTGSDYFLTNHLDWKFLPGEYKGCEPI
jgi:hypothetical protein